MLPSEQLMISSPATRSDIPSSQLGIIFLCTSSRGADLGSSSRGAALGEQLSGSSSRGAALGEQLSVSSSRGAALAEQLFVSKRPLYGYMPCRLVVSSTLRRVRRLPAITGSLATCRPYSSSRWKGTAMCSAVVEHVVMEAAAAVNKAFRRPQYVACFGARRSLRRRRHSGVPRLPVPESHNVRTREDESAM